MPGLVAVLIFGHQIIVALEDPSKVSYVLIATTAIGLAVAMYLGSRWFARQARLRDA
ncbi:MAG TPA: hypothetical protein VEQ87_21580 [Burkholderiales bacterium]|nr:hypothetical protein [Burkholderiales bacterium]